MRILSSIFGALFLAVSLVGCSKEPGAISNEEAGGKQSVTFRFNVAGGSATKANNTADIPLTDWIKRLDLYVYYENNSDLNYHVTLFPETEEEAELTVEGVNGERAGVLAFANLDDDTAAYFEGTSLEDFDNENNVLGRFVLEANNFDYDRVPMVGAADYSFSSYYPDGGTKEISLRRLMTRIELDKIVVAFEDESLLGKEVYVKNVAITNIMNFFTPLQSSSIGHFYTSYLFFGNEGSMTDAFGGVDYGFKYMLSYSDNMYNGTFTMEGTGDLDGDFAYQYNKCYKAGKGVLVLDAPGKLAEMTIQSYDNSAGEGLIVAEGDMAASHTFDVKKCFYTLFWNASWPLYSVVCDAKNELNTQKLLVVLSIDGREYYYPIQLAYLQPNTCYKVDKITIKNVGSDYANYSPKKYPCDFTISVLDWNDCDITNLNVGIDPETGEPVTAYDE